MTENIHVMHKRRDSQSDEDHKDQRRNVTIILNNDI